MCSSHAGRPDSETKRGTGGETTRRLCCMPLEDLTGERSGSMTEADEQVRPYVDCVGSEFLRWAVVATKRCVKSCSSMCAGSSPRATSPAGRCTETPACRRI